MKLRKRPFDWGCHRFRRFVWRWKWGWLAIFLIVVLPQLVWAQKPNKTFPLGKPITEMFVGCLEQKDAIDIAKAMAVSDRAADKVLAIKFNADVCRPVHWTVTYHTSVFEVDDPKNGMISVYRGTVNGKDIYVPMSGWEPEGRI